MNQNQRDRIAIRTVLVQMVETSYPEIALRAGEGLASPLMEMVRDGEVERVAGQDGGPVLYRLVDAKATPMQPGTGGTSMAEVLRSVDGLLGEPVRSAFLTTEMPTASTPDRLAAEQSARDLKAMLMTGEATLVDKSGSI